MKILSVLTYYRPHTSGLTIYAEHLGKALAKLGHEVTILTSQYDKSLPLEEVSEGVRIVRVPVAFRISKGVIMPSFGITASKLVAQHDVIHLHLPQFDAAGLAVRGWLFKKPTVVTYHCDLLMPPGFISKLANQAILMMNAITGIFSDKVVAYTQDYADHSHFLKRYKDKVVVIPPPVDLPATSPDDVAAFRQRFNPENKSPVIGMATRFAAEKGIEVLLNAMPALLARHPDLLVLYSGKVEGIIGEEAYLARLMPQIEKYKASGNWRFVGNLSLREIAAFYQTLDVLTVPSLNSTESFGLVQIEAMQNAVPCVTSNLPGVRYPVRTHGMGKIFEIGSAAGLTEAMLEVLENHDVYQTPRVDVKEPYKPENVAQRYLQLFESLQKA